jgi:type II secretory pathway component PulM
MSAVTRRLPLPASLTAAWDRASTRERRLAGTAALVVALAVGWAVFWRPLIAEIERVRAERERVVALLAASRALVADGAALAREARTPGGDPRAAIARVLAGQDLRPSGQLVAQDGRVGVVLPEAQFDRLIAALAALAKDEGLRAVEATLTARVEPGSVRAELTLAR